MAENMVKAGRASLTFGDDWDSTVEYNRLVGVRYDNKLFFSKKPVPVGTIPEDGEYWFLAIEGLTDEQYEALLNGNQQVGNAKTLDGHEAEHFASVEELFATVKSYKKADFNNIISTGIYVSEAKPSSEGASNYPIDLTGILIVFGGVTTSQRYVTHSGIVYERACFPGLGWTQWKEVFTTNDTNQSVISRKTNTPIAVNNNAEGATTAYIAYLINGVALGRYGFSGVDKPVFKTASGTDRDFLHTGNMADHVIAKNGGRGNNIYLTSEVEGAKGYGNIFKNNSATADYGTIIKDVNEGATKTAHLQIIANSNTFDYKGTDGVAHAILHTGNKPTGTYTGNGDATERTINTGGIGNSLVINGLYTTVWVGNNGAIGIYQDSTIIGFLNKSEAFFKNGVLTINTAKGLVNTSGETFTYQVL